MNWKLVSLDIKYAFLQEYPLQRDLFVRPPKDTGAIRCVCKLNKVVYGLSDASRAWYLRVVDELSKLGGRVSNLTRLCSCGIKITDLLEC